MWRLRRWLFLLFYRSGIHPGDSYLAFVEGLVAEEPCRVLDLGCGRDAPVLKALQRGSLEKVGVDPVEDLRRSTEDCEWLIRAEGARLPFADGTFDVVICRSVLEHLEVPQPTFDEVARVLADEGLFVFLTPNCWDYVSVGARLIPNRYHPVIVRKLTGRAERDTFPTFYRANTRHALKALARGSGLVVTRLEFLRQQPGYLRANTLTYAAGIAYEQLVARFLPALRPVILGVMFRPPREAGLEAVRIESSADAVTDLGKRRV